MGFILGAFVGALLYLLGKGNRSHVEPWVGVAALACPLLAALFAGAYRERFWNVIWLRGGTLGTRLLLWVVSLTAVLILVVWWWTRLRPGF
jgi:hypothetical protein